MDPYLAAGVAVDLQFAQRVKVLPGISVAAGSYVWFSDQVGMDVELDVNGFFERGTVLPECLLAAGPVLRF